MNILLVRNDKLGDFVLSLPCYAIIKKAQPDIKITVLVPEYTAEIARCCPHIDRIIVDPQKNNISEIYNLIKQLRTNRFSAVITLYSTTRIGLAISLSDIKYRLSPATKIAQIFYNHRLKQRRSLSEKPEYAYNIDLVKQYLFDHGVRKITEPEPPFLSFDATVIEQQRALFCQQFNVDKTTKLIFIHAGSGGSANNLSLEQYANLAANLNRQPECKLVLTAGPGEEDKVESLSKMIHKIPHVVYHSKHGLATFAKHIAFANLFISGSTGPLHIAGALNIPTAAFYTRRRSATPVRWQTLNTPDRRLAFTPPETADEMDMSQINIDEAARVISEKFLQD